MRRVEEAAGDVPDPGRERGREEQRLDRLLLLRCCGGIGGSGRRSRGSVSVDFPGGPEDLLDVVDEPHVEHLVALVQHAEPQVPQLERAALQVVLDSPRSADDDVDAAAERAFLGLVLRPPVQTQARQAVRSPDGLEVRRDLLGELAGRGQDDAARRAAVGAALRRVAVPPLGGNPREPLDDREDKRERLAAAGPCPSDDVRAVEDQVERRRLDREQRRDPSRAEGGPGGSREAELVD